MPELSDKTARIAVTIEICDRSGQRSIDIDGSALQLDCEGGAHAEPALLLERIRREIGIDVALLRVCDSTRVEAEHLNEPTRLPAGWIWRDRSFISYSRRSPWEMPGWLRRTTERLDSVLVRIGIKRIGCPIQRRHTSVTGLLEIPTDRGHLWLKAVPDHFAHEARVVQWLGRRFPEASPKVLAREGEWWLAEQFQECADSPCGDPLVVVAQMQVAAADHLSELSILKIPQRPLHVLSDQIAEVSRRQNLLSNIQYTQLSKRLSQISAICEEVDRLGFPITLVHGDISPGNVLWTAKGWLIYDWTDACLGHPFVELASPLSYETDWRVIKSRQNAFCAIWQEYMPLAKVRRALARSETIGAAHQVITYIQMLDSVDRTTGDQAGFTQLKAFVSYWIDKVLSSIDAGQDI